MIPPRVRDESAAPISAPSSTPRILPPLISSTRIPAASLAPPDSPLLPDQPPPPPSSLLLSRARNPRRLARSWFPNAAAVHCRTSHPLLAPPPSSSQPCECPSQSIVGPAPPLPRLHRRTTSIAARLLASPRRTPPHRVPLQAPWWFSFPNPSKFTGEARPLLSNSLTRDREDE